MIFRDNQVIEIIIDETTPAIYSIGKIVTNDKLEKFKS